MLSQRENQKNSWLRRHLLLPKFTPLTNKQSHSWHVNLYTSWHSGSGLRGSTLLLEVVVLVLELTTEPRLWPRGLLELFSGSGNNTGVIRPPRAVWLLRGEVEDDVLLLLDATALVLLGLRPNPASTVLLWWGGRQCLDVITPILPFCWEDDDKEGGGTPESFSSAMLGVWVGLDYDFH